MNDWKWLKGKLLGSEDLLFCYLPGAMFPSLSLRVPREIVGWYLKYRENFEYPWKYFGKFVRKFEMLEYFLYVNNCLFYSM